jgi:hypothetical protein
MGMLETFPLARYRFEFQVTRPIRLPDYAGSMLRGAFGHALRQLACMTRQKECTGCPLTSTCPYPAIFAPLPPATHTLQKFSQIPVPYIIEPPAWGATVLESGDTLVFHMVLVGRVLRDLPLIILAWRRALTRGVGAGDGTAELLRVIHCTGSKSAPKLEIHRPENGSITPHQQAVNLHGEDDQQMTSAILHFHTPLRLQKNGHALPPEKLDARTLLMALVRRSSLLAEFHADGPLVSDFSGLVASCVDIHDNKNLVWLDWTRYSSRQQQKMSLGGVVGPWMLEGNLSTLAPFLRLGEWLHVGKEATFGLGGYTLENRRLEDISGHNEKGREQHGQAVEVEKEIG